MAEDYAKLVNETVEKFGKDRGRLMDIARALHAELGHLSEDTIGLVADALGIHRVEVRDMASFYAFFSREPKGRATIRLCNAVVERMKGADEVAKAFEEAVGCSFGETSEDGKISLEYTPCIGMSDQPPSALVNGVVLTRIRPQDVPGIVAALRKGEGGGRLHEGGYESSEVELNLRQTGPVVFAPMERGAAIRKAVNMTADDVINELNRARVRGRGGAGFPTAMKWDFCRKAEADAHYVVCNGDEGEPGTFKDRVILTEQADLLFEGMTVAGYAIGAQEGFLYLRGEYEYLIGHLQQTLAKRRRLGLLGENICGREGFNFDIRIQLGAGAYVCGEESALIESLEGKRGAPRDRPPFPVQKGYLSRPSSVNNVETLCCAARIIEHGADWFAAMGTKDSTGTKLLSVSGDCERPGVYELEYGITVEKLLELVGADGAQAVQIGGPSGQCLAPKDFGRAISFEDVPTGGSVIVFGPERNLLECMRQFIEFFVDESCGWCAPCRVGTTLLLKQLEKVLEGKGTRADLDQLERLGVTVKTMSRCGLGQTAANPILTTLRNFPDLYDNLIKPGDFIPSFDLKKAIAESCAITGRNPELEEEHV
ncbi:MAG: NAD(P)H-dependent oxidoreductase subunit E [Candidatus Hydrogenedentes bacterium]|nr:NAD(P)H-dependent oxidoreductase subunit E [Candidatus Hydrogenedentota bacterium]